MGRENRYSPDVRERAVRLVREHENERSSQWAAIQSVAGKIGCSQRNDFMELIEDRHGLRSTLVASQLPVEHWHEYLRSDARRRDPRQAAAQRTPPATEGRFDARTTAET